MKNGDLPVYGHFQYQYIKELSSVKVLGGAKPDSQLESSAERAVLVTKGRLVENRDNWASCFELEEREVTNFVENKVACNAIKLASTTKKLERNEPEVKRYLAEF